jgi:DNA-binding CsgD family transcriptional regulator
VPLSRPQRSTKLVGRAREVDELARALERVSSGSPYVVEIVGEPGVGKSTLLAELARRADERGCLVLDGRAAEFERDIPFGLIVDALNDYAGALEPSVLRALDAEALEELGSILPSLSAHASAKTERRPDAERYRVHYALRALLERLASRQPVLLSLDDAHWADPASLEVIAHLLRRFRGPLLAAVAVRHAPRQVAAALENVARVESGVRLELQPLSEQEARELIDPAFDTATWATIFRESGGNPFYLQQLARAQFATGQARTVSAAPSAGGTFLPAPVLAALEGELDSLTSECRRVLDAAAIAGESFEPELVGAIAECDVALTLATLDDLLRVDLIRPTGAPRRFRFRHPIVRRAVYDAMPGGWQISAHARAADALAAAGARTGELAHHIERSASVGDETAIALLVDGARDAARRAPATAGRWLLAAADLLPPSAERERRAGLLGEAASALTSAGIYEDSLAAAHEALSLTPSDEVDKRAELTAMLAYARRRSGNPFDSRVPLERALTSLARPDNPAGLSVQLELALDRLWHGQFGPMLELTERLGLRARDRTDAPMLTLAASLSSVAHSSRREVADASADLREAQDAYGRVSDDQLAERIYVSFYVALAALRLERADDALAHLNRGLEVARMTGQAATVIPWTAIAATALLLKGRVREAADAAAAAIDQASLSRNDFRTVWALEADALAAYWAGDSERALASAREMVRRSGKTHTFLADPARIQLAGALCAAGDHEAAAAELTTLDAKPTRRLLDLHAAHGWGLLVQALLALGDVESAKGCAARAADRASTAGLPCQLAATRWCQAAVSLAGDDLEAALEMARDACAIADAAANPLLSARGRALTGLALAASGRRDEALPELQHAERALWACGATREADAAARELRRRGARVRRARSRPDAGLTALTPRESEIANRVALGESNRQIASVLFLSEKTIESHLVRAYAKLGVHSRSALTAIVVSDGRRVERSQERDFSGA